MKLLRFEAVGKPEKQPFMENKNFFQSSRKKGLWLKEWVN
jgi:hypothetical protein